MGSWVYNTAKPAKGFGKTPLQAVYFLMLRARVGKNLSGRSNVCVCVCVLANYSEVPNDRA